MPTTVTVEREVDTLDDLRAAIAEADRLGLPGDQPVHVKTRATWSSTGQRLRQITIAGTPTTTPTDRTGKH